VGSREGSCCLSAGMTSLAPL